MFEPDITEETVFTALREFLLSVISCTEVVRALDNRVPMPPGGFILMSPVTQVRLATNISSYTLGAPDTKNVTQKIKFTAQIDCFGTKSNPWATTIATLLRDDFAVTKFPANVVPLYADDPRQIDFTDGEMQFEERWMVQAHFQYDPTIQVPAQLATTLAAPAITTVQ